MSEKIEATGTDLNVYLDYITLLGDSGTPRLTVEVNLGLDEVVKIIEKCRVTRAGGDNRRYKVTIEEMEFY